MQAGLEVPSPLLDQVLELSGVDRVWVDPEQIARRLPDDRVRRQQLAELRDVDLERVGRGLGRVAGPELLDQCVCRDDLVPVQEQQREQSSRLLCCELQPAAVVAFDFQRAKDPKLHRHPLLATFLKSSLRRRSAFRKLSAGGLCPLLR